ncbi:hypothetical protein CEXT_136691 [Caerostris extrusa]|uniref:Secreted protein n=1 Tax=Caerostris extrusa TaxID=172846 RepID=A0AAV4YG28_CAEEX|nr:hypothetical protein CEXT_136691 [Caerostris extrusa]
MFTFAACLHTAVIKRSLWVGIFHSKTSTDVVCNVLGLYNVAELEKIALVRAATVETAVLLFRDFKPRNFPFDCHSVQF